MAEEEEPGDGEAREEVKMEKQKTSDLNTNMTESTTDAEIDALINKIHSSHEGKQSRRVCGECGRRHHSSRMPWTHSNACNPVGGIDFDDDDFQNAEDEGDEAEPHLFHRLPIMFDDAQVNSLLLMAMNLCFSFAVGFYFDERFLQLIHQHHRELFPPPLKAQLAHFLFVVLISFWSLQTFWRALLPVVL